MKTRLKAWVRYDGMGRVIPGGPVLSLKRPKVGNWQEIPANLCCNPTTTTTTAMPLPLRMTFTDIAITEAMIGSPADDLAAWNTFFDLPALGSPFTSVSAVGNVVELYGGGNIYLKDYIFDIHLQAQYGENLLKFEDFDGVVVSSGFSSFGYWDTGGCMNMTDLYLPSCVSADDYSFNGCSALTSPYLPLLKTAGIGCFNYCQSLNCNFPSLESAGELCFENCISLINPIFNKLKSCDSRCFSVCVGLINPEFPKLENIGESCFEADLALINGKFNSLLNIGNFGFRNCSSLNCDFPLLQIVGDNGFEACGLGNVNFDSLKTIGFESFVGCYTLISNFPNLISCDHRSFFNCTSLSSINSPLLEIIGDSCFNGCVSLTSLNLPSLTAMGSDVLDNSVLASISGKTITLTVPIALATCNAGQPDGDIQSFLTNNPLSTVVYV